MARLFLHHAWRRALFRLVAKESATGCVGGRGRARLGCLLGKNLPQDGATLQRRPRCLFGGANLRRCCLCPFENEFMQADRLTGAEPGLTLELTLDDQSQ